MQQGQFPWEEFEPLVEVDAPLLVVDPSAAYTPSLDEIIEFIQRSAVAQARSTSTRTDGGA